VELVQNPSTLAWLRVLFVGSPAILAIFGILVSTRFPITPESHAILRGEISRLRQGGAKEAVEPEVRRVCEALSGHSYEELYPRKV